MGEEDITEEVRTRELFKNGKAGGIAGVVGEMKSSETAVKWRKMARCLVIG